MSDIFVFVDHEEVCDGSRGRCIGEPHVCAGCGEGAEFFADKVESLRVLLVDTVDMVLKRLRDEVEEGFGRGRRRCCDGEVREGFRERGLR